MRVILNANYSQIGQSAELLSVSQIRIEFYGKVKFMNDLQKNKSERPEDALAVKRYQLITH